MPNKQSKNKKIRSWKAWLVNVNGHMSIYWYEPGAVVGFYGTVTPVLITTITKGRKKRG